MRIMILQSIFLTRYSQYRAYRPFALSVCGLGDAAGLFRTDSARNWKATHSAHLQHREGFIAAVKLPGSGDPVLSASSPYRIGQLTQHSAIPTFLVRIIQNTFKHPVLKLSKHIQHVRRDLKQVASSQTP